MKTFFKTKLQFSAMRVPVGLTEVCYEEKTFNEQRQFSWLCLPPCVFSVRLRFNFCLVLIYSH